MTKQSRFSSPALALMACTSGNSIMASFADTGRRVFHSVLPLALLLALAAPPAFAGTLAVTDTGASAPTTCTLAQAIYAANLANNPANTTPTGATTIAPLSRSATTTIGVGTCTGATAGANTIQLPISATINFGSDTPDNFWYGPNALPPVASNIIVDGRGAMLSITLGASPRLRFFYVGANPQGSATPNYNTPGPGVLTLRNLTLSGGRQVGGESWRGGGGAGMGGAIFNQGTLTLEGVTATDNRAMGGHSGVGSSAGGAGMGGGRDMGGAVPPGTSEPGQNGNLAAGTGGAGGGVPTGLAGAGSNNNTGTGGPGGNGGGGGGGSAMNSAFYNAGGGGGFGGGPGGLGARSGASLQPTGGAFGIGGISGTGGGGGVGAGGAGDSTSLAAGGGGFGGGGGNAFRGGSGGFGGGNGSGLQGAVGYGGGEGFPDNSAEGGAGAGMGGVIFNHHGQLQLINSTLTNNSAMGGSARVANIGGKGGAGFGGSIFNLNGSVYLGYSTIAGNSVAGGAHGTSYTGAGAALGGAVFSLAYNAAASAGSTTALLTLENSILAGSTGGVDLVVEQPGFVVGGLANAASATTTATGTNFVMSTIAGGSATLPLFNASNPLLGPLANNGGPTATMALLAGSPAIDAATGGTPPSVDQRGLGRPAGSAPDVGAFEFGALGVAPQITSPALPNGSFGVPYSQTVAASGAPTPSFSVSAGALPPGLTLNADSGVVSGTPTSVGTSSGTITASNGIATPAMQDFEITIAAVVPGAPTGVVATRGNASVSVAFAAPTSNGGSAIISFQATCGGQSASGTASPIVVGSLTNGVAVTCTVIATNGIGDSAPSAASNSVTPATVPGAPTSVAATPGNGSADFQFNPPASDGGAAIIDYTVLCTPGNVQVTGGAAPLTLGGLTNGSSYSCSVRARNGLGSGPTSETVNVIPTGGGPSSSDLSITNTNNTRFVTGGAPTSYLIVVSNAGPDAVSGARVQDALEPDFSNPTWTCVGQNGGICTASGTGNLDELVNLPVGASVRFILTAEIAELPETPVSNMASVTAPGPVSDPILSNNVATDGPDVRGIIRASFE